MRFSNVTKSNNTNAYVPLFYKNKGDLESILLFFSVGLDDDGDPMIAIYDPMTSKPVVWYSLSTINDGKIRINFNSNQEALFELWNGMPTTVHHGMRFEDFCEALTYAFHAGDMVKYGDNIDPEFRFRQSALAFLPHSSMMCPDDAFSCQKSKEIRNIANALGLTVSSIKREDCVAAIREAREQFQLTDSVISHHIVGINFDPDSRSPFTVVKVADDGKWQPIPFDADELDDHFPFLNRHDYVRASFGKDQANGIVQVASASHAALSGANIPVGPIFNAVQMLEKQSWFANQQVGSLREEIARLEAAMRKNDEQTRKMIAAMSAATTITVPTGKGIVEVMGVEFPHFAHPDAPSAIPNYSLDFWSARIQLGGGADHVEFNATDFMGVVLHDIVSSLVGPPGTGKTTICVQVAYTLGIPCTIVQFTRDKPIESLIGVDKIRDGQQVFVDGEITVAMRAAAADPDTPHLIVFDEFDHAPSEVQSDFHGVVEGRDYTLPNGEVIKNHGNLRFVLTRNTSGHGDQTGRHASANISDSAFNSRIQSAMIVQYMKQEQECVLLCTHGLDADEAEQVVKFANATRKSVESMDSGECFDGMTEPVCLRHLIGYAHARRRGVTKRKALAMCILAHLPQGDRRVANEMIVSHINLGN